MDLDDLKEELSAARERAPLKYALCCFISLAGFAFILAPFFTALGAFIGAILGALLTLVCTALGFAFAAFLLFLAIVAYATSSQRKRSPEPSADDDE